MRCTAVEALVRWQHSERGLLQHRLRRADAVQGFRYSRPTNAADFAAWLALHIAGQAPARSIGDVVNPITAARHTG